MKNLKTALLLLTMATLFVAASTSPAKADHYGPYHPNTYGHNGYWDHNHHYHHWENYHGHQGYWDNNGGARIFINL